MPEIKKVDASLYKLLNTGAIVKLANRLLLTMNKTIANHNERTAYISLKIAQYHKMNEKCTIQNLVFLGLFHTIGFFRDDFSYNITTDNTAAQNPKDIVYFSQDKSVVSKYIFGCYYLEYMTPLNSDARALENFNQPYNKDLKKYIYQEEYKSILYLAARISDYLEKNPDKSLPKDINDLAPGYFDPEYVEVFQKLNANGKIEKKIKDKSYRPELFNYIENMDCPISDHIKMVKLLIYLLDFKSTFTMKHSINTSCYAVSLGLRMGLNGKDLIDLFISAFLHDVGKIGIPARILESPNKLTHSERKIMEKHVDFSKRILEGILNDKIVENVYRHHEKLNGNGYPQHISGNSITLTQRILTVADITSALHDSRSYKEEFSKERTINIISDMTTDGELDPEITKYIISDFDTIQKELSYLQELLSVDFSNVIQKYNDYIYNDTDKYTEKIFNFNDEDIEDIEDIEELDDVEELDDIEEIEELDDDNIEK